MVTAEGYWKAKRNADKTVFENHSLKQAEDMLRWAYPFPPFVLDAIRELAGLATLSPPHFGQDFYADLCGFGQGYCDASYL